MEAHGDVAGDLQPVHGFEDEKRDAAGPVFAGDRVRAADLRVVGVVVEQAGDVPDDFLVVGDAAGCAVGFVVRAQQFVELVQGAAAAPHAVEGLEPGEELDGFAQGARRAVDQPFVHGGDVEEILCEGWILFSGGHFPDVLHVAGDPLLDTQDHGFLTVVEGGVFGLVEVAVATDLFEQTAPSQIQADAHVRTEVIAGTDAGFEIVLIVQVGQVHRTVLGQPAFDAGDGGEDPGAGQGAHGVGVHRVGLEPATEVFADVFDAAADAGRVIGVGFEVDGFVPGDAAVVVDVVIAALFDFLAGMCGFGAAQGVDAGLVGEVGGGLCGGHAVGSSGVSCIERCVRQVLMKYTTTNVSEKNGGSANERVGGLRGTAGCAPSRWLSQLGFGAAVTWGGALRKGAPD